MSRLSSALLPGFVFACGLIGGTAFFILTPSHEAHMVMMLRDNIAMETDAIQHETWMTAERLALTAMPRLDRLTANKPFDNLSSRQISHHLMVSPVGNTLNLDMRLRLPDVDQARNFLRTLAEDYRSETAAQLQNETIRQRDWLQQRLATIEGASTQRLVPAVDGKIVAQTSQNIENARQTLAQGHLTAAQHGALQKQLAMLTTARNKQNELVMHQLAATRHETQLAARREFLEEQIRAMENGNYVLLRQMRIVVPPYIASVNKLIATLWGIFSGTVVGLMVVIPGRYFIMPRWGRS